MHWIKLKGVLHNTSKFTQIQKDGKLGIRFWVGDESGEVAVYSTECNRDWAFERIEMVFRCEEELVN